MKQLDTHTFNDIIGCSPGHFGAGVFVGSTSARMFRCDSLQFLGISRTSEFRLAPQTRCQSMPPCLAWIGVADFEWNGFAETPMRFDQRPQYR